MAFLRKGSGLVDIIPITIFYTYANAPSSSRAAIQKYQMYLCLTFCLSLELTLVDNEAFEGG